MATIQIILSILLLFGYTVTFCIKTGGVPPSLSASVFDLPMNKRWIWTVMLYSVVLLCLVPYIGKAESGQTMAFLALAGLGIVGAVPLVADTKDMGYQVHCGAAIMCAVCSQVVLVLNQPWLLLCWLPFIVTWMIVGKWRTKTFWAEMVCFVSTFAFCLI